MFIASRLTFLELHKTGSTHISRLLQRTIGGNQLGQHNRLLPEMNPHCVVGSIRNPWDWYVSLWAYGIRRLGGLDSRLRRYPEWARTYQSTTDVSAFRAWLQMLFDPDRVCQIGERYDESRVRHLAGFLTHRYLRLFSRDEQSLYEGSLIQDVEEIQAFDRANNVVDFFIRNHCLETDLMACLQQAGYQLRYNQRWIIKWSMLKPTNTTNHLPAASYYDPESAAWVAERERFIIDRFGFVSPLDSLSPVRSTLPTAVTLASD